MRYQWSHLFLCDSCDLQQADKRRQTPAGLIIPLAFTGHVHKELIVTKGQATGKGTRDSHYAVCVTVCSLNSHTHTYCMLTAKHTHTLTPMQHYMKCAKDAEKLQCRRCICLGKSNFKAAGILCSKHGSFAVPPETQHVFSYTFLQRNKK